MSPTVRRLLLLVLIIGLPQLDGGVRAYEAALRQDLRDAVDPRPVVSVLFIGNSRTSANNLPAMVRTVADSAHSKYRFRVGAHTPAATMLLDHEQNPQVRELLRQHWDYVVLQGGSSEQINSVMQVQFFIHGMAMVRVVQDVGSRPVLFVAWRSMPEVYEETRDLPPAQFYDQIQRSYALVAQTGHADMVNVGRAWETLLAENMPLHVDGNHPSMLGTYLAALMFYRYLSGDDPRHVTFVPAGVSPDHARRLQQAASEQAPAESLAH